ncbi:MAG: class I SAM-dependent methyltransferase [Burkholderiales bacterium]|jgi:SAM-dependent methyltransferase|nr:class I SAM-dependent methyltransferase [Burkholderiales bacterium]
MTTEPQRRSRAALERHARVSKAIKIEALLSAMTPIHRLPIHEDGTGAGYIAAHFASHVGSGGEVWAVNVFDQCQIHEDFFFELVRDTQLPFPDEPFDIRTSNHLLEYVGTRESQIAPLREIRPVLEATGWLYVALPNCWILIEPHFNLALLSWLPRSQRDRYLRLAGRGNHYDCDPPSHAELEALPLEADLDPREVSVDGIKAVAQLEHGPGLRRSLLRHPEP